jgi:aminoglycoside/choline kinase family phosphotransferase
LEYEQLIQRVQDITGMPLSSFKLAKLKGDASERNFYRISIAERQSQVLMEFNPPEHKRQTQLELVWRYFDRHNLGVPQLYRHDLEGGLLFFEDCGDLSLEQLAHNEPAEIFYPYYEQAIELLLSIQQAGYGDNDPDCPAFGLAFDTEKLKWELDFFLQYMLEENRGLKLPAKDKQKLRAHFHDLSRQLADEPRCLTHRDYHSRNIMIKDGLIRLVDFQDARMGLPQYDLASLLRDSYVQLSEAQVDKLLIYYIRRRREIDGVALDPARFRRLFDYTCVQRNLKAVGTFAYLACRQNKLSYLKFIPPTLEYVRQNLNKYPQLAALNELLGRYLPEVN